jgi:hypothetical protein
VQRLASATPQPVGRARARIEPGRLAKMRSTPPKQPRPF